MEDSAVLNRRERKMQETAARITSVSRRLTAERGLSGFTVEEVCDEVDISRRTFFNYFPSKEDAVMGANQAEEATLFAEQFLARDSDGWPKVIDDLVDIVIEHFSGAGLDVAGHGEFMAAIEREPKLLVRFIGVTRDREREAMALVAVREGVSADDPRAEAAINVLTTIIRSAGDQFFAPDNTSDVSSLMLDSLAALRVVLAPSPPRKA